MKDIKKQIEDIALLLQSYSNINQSYYSGEWHSDDVYHGLAKSLYYNNLRIVSKDSVVLSKDEFEKVEKEIIKKSTYDTIWKAGYNAYDKTIGECIIEANKQLAEQIINPLLDVEVIDGDYKQFFLDICGKLEELADKHGVEIKEN